MITRDINMILKLRRERQSVEELGSLRKGLSGIETQIRNIQQLGKLRKTPIFEQDLKSIKVLQKEIEILNQEMVNIFKPGLLKRGAGVTDQMIKDFQKARKEAEALKDALFRIPEAIDLLKNVEAEFDKLKEKTGESSRTLIGLAREYRKTGEVSVVEAKKMVEAYEMVRQELVKMFESMGVFTKGAVIDFKADTWAAKYAKAQETVNVSMAKAKNIAKDLEMQYLRTYEQIVRGAERVASISAGTLKSQNEQIQAQMSYYEKWRMDTERLQQAYLELGVAVKMGGEAFKGSSYHMERLNELQRRGTEHLRQYVGMNNVFVKSMVTNLEVQKRMTVTLEFLQKQYIETATVVIRLMNEERLLGEVTKEVGKNENILQQRLNILRNIMEILSVEIIKLITLKKQLGIRTLQNSKEFDFLSAKILETQARMEKFTIKIGEVNDALGKIRRRTGDAARAMDRMSAEGFGNMIISQAAWMAGFKVVFGTLDAFKAALNSSIQLQEALARAMRTARSDTKNQKEMFELYKDAIIRARIETGAAIQDLGEIMYQLGSAGLSAEQSVAALNSTLSSIIATEDDVRELTKLVASLYNNFADQIYRVDGKLTSLSNTFDDYNTKVVEAVSMNEKFKYINDLLIRAFDENQIEMNELRDGLKFMAQSGRAANLSLEDMAGILAFLNNHLIRAGTAGRSMRVILSRLTKDASKFAEAFNIKIDLDKPLNFLNIMKEVHKTYGEQIISVEKLGKIFKNMGLRGAEAFNLIQRNVGEVETTISRLRDNLEGAADRMRDIRLSDFASQAKITTANVEALLRKGVEPFLESAGFMVSIVNSLSKGLAKINDSLSGTLGFIIRIIGTVGAIMTFAFAVTHLGKAFGWASVVGKTLFLRMKDLGKETEASVSIMDKLRGVFTGIGAAFTGLRNEISTNIVALNQTSKATNALTRTFPVVTNVVNATKASVTGLASAFMGLSAIMKTAIVTGVIVAIYKLASYFDETIIRLKSAAKEQQNLVYQADSYIIKLELALKIIEKSTKITNENREAVNKLASEIGLLGKKYSDESKYISDISSKTEKLIIIQKKLLDIQRDIAKEKNLKLISVEFSKIKNAADPAVGAFKELWSVISNFNNKLTEVGLNLKENIMFGAGRKEVITGGIDFYGERVTEATKKVDFFMTRIKMLESSLKTETNIGREARNKEELSRYREELDIQLKLRDTYQEKLQYYKEERIELHKTDILLKDQAKSFEKIEEAKHKAIESIKEYSKQIIEMKKISRQIDVFSEAFRNLNFRSVTTLEEIKQKFKDIERESYVVNFADDLNLLRQRLIEVGDKEVEIKKLWNDTNKLGIDGVKSLQSYSDELSVVLKKVGDLERTHLDLEVERIKFQYGDLSTSLERSESQLSSLIQTSEKHLSANDKIRDSILKEKATLYDLQEQYRTMNSSSEKYRETQEKIYAQQGKISIIEGRLERQRALERKELDKGIISLETMRARTETYLQTQEDLKISLLEATAAHRSAISGSDKERETKSKLEAIQRALTDAINRTNAVKAEETTNTARLIGEYDKIKIKYAEQLKLLKDQEAVNKLRIFQAEHEIMVLGRSAASMEKKKDLYGILRKQIEEQIKTLDSQFEKEKKIIELQKKAGEITGLDAYLRNQNLIVEYDRRKLELSKKNSEVLSDEQNIISELKNEYNEMARNLTRSIEELGKEVNSLREFFVQIRKVVEQQITIHLNDKEVRAVTDLFDKYFVNKEYNITVRVKEIEYKGKYLGGIIKKARGGLVPAMVSSGEGYVPPNKAWKNLDALNSLNGGRSTPFIPNSVKMFKGPGGVDNIFTMLPSGSYVLSRRGMDAYSKSMKEGAVSFQEGGEVNEEMIPRGNAPRDVGTFTIVVQKGGTAREFPVYGKVSVLEELKNELEEERLTKLH